MTGDDGTEIEYSIVEEPMEGYEVEVTGNVEEGFVVTNTEIVPEPEEEPVETTGQMLPKTATNNFTLGLIGALMIALGSGFYLFHRRRTRKEN